MLYTYIPQYALLEGTFTDLNYTFCTSLDKPSSTLQETFVDGLSNYDSQVIVNVLHLGTIVRLMIALQAWDPDGWLSVLNPCTNVTCN